MILPLFLVLLGLVVLCVLLGYFTDDEPYLTVGLFLLFLLSSLIILPGNLEYQTGDVKNVTFTYNASTLTAQNEITTDTYVAWHDTQSRTVGWLLSIASIFGFILSLINIRRNRKEDNP